MSKKSKRASKLDEGASKLDEGAAKLDEGATKLHEGASVLHEVAARLSAARHDRDDKRQQAEPLVKAPRLTSPLLSLRHSGARAVDLVKRHPLGTVATVGAAVALIEVELAVGILTGVGAAALLTQRTGPETRQRMLAGGRSAVSRARGVWANRSRWRARLPEPAAEAAPAS
jgi:X-X-X-Leu-X-X-Gly heptad repeat protein